MKLKRRLYPLHRLLILVLILLWAGVPIFFLVLSSFKEAKTIFDFPPKIFFKPTFQNFVSLFKKWPEFTMALKNSLLITAGAALLTVTVSFLAGYAYSRYRSKLLTASAFSMIIIRMLPPIVITIPLYPVIQALNLFDNHITLIIFYSAFFVSLGTWLMKSFIDQIPRELEESAFIDGASRLRMLGSIILPLSTHGMVATSTFVIIFAWKEYLFAMLFATTNAKTAPLIISEMLGSVTGVQWGSLFAAATVQLIPILIYVLAIQKVLVEGITTGSIKG
ncbi:MAG TPA: carbohydrate ABC transporter permease [Spirochaetia bacterium]|nr:carbohydrate ABC transporter permease [Spirochaetia bacterium]